jgi:alkyl hydroperoxide reductase subunit AhpF
MQVMPIPKPKAQIHEAICAASAPADCAAWNTTATELVKPTITVTAPANTAETEISLKKDMRGITLKSKTCILSLGAKARAMRVNLGDSLDN